MAALTQTRNSTHSLTHSPTHPRTTHYPPTIRAPLPKARPAADGYIALDAPHTPVPSRGYGRLGALGLEKASARPTAVPKGSAPSNWTATRRRCHASSFVRVAWLHAMVACPSFFDLLTHARIESHPEPSSVPLLPPRPSQDRLGPRVTTVGSHGCHGSTPSHTFFSVTRGGRPQIKGRCSSSPGVGPVAPQGPSGPSQQ